MYGYALALRITRPMPADGQQTGWIGAAIGGGIVAAIAGLFALFKSWLDRGTVVKAKEIEHDAQLEAKKIEHDDRQLDAIVSELTSLRATSAAQQSTIAQLLDHRDMRGKEMLALQTTVDRMQLKIEHLETRESEYEKVIKQKDALIEEQAAMIASLETRLADMEVIGTAETGPPKRMRQSKE